MQTPSTVRTFFLCFSLVLWKELNIHPAVPLLPARWLLVAQTLCFTHIFITFASGHRKVQAHAGKRTLG